MKRQLFKWGARILFVGVLLFGILHYGESHPVFRTLSCLALGAFYPPLLLHTKIRQPFPITLSLITAAYLIFATAIFVPQDFLLFGVVTLLSALVTVSGIGNYQKRTDVHHLLYKWFYLFSAVVSVLLGRFVFSLRSFSTAWITIPLFLGLLLLISILHLLLSYVVSLFVHLDKPVTKEHPIFRFWVIVTVEWFLMVSRIFVEVEGKEQLNPHTKYLFVCNHRSRFDPMVCMVEFKNFPMAFISKESNFHMPIAGRFVHMCRYLPIDRDNPRAALKTIHTAASILADDLSIGVYPEGTRSTDGTLLPFHDGVFLIAGRAKAPIAVLVMEGTEQIHRNFPFHRTHVKVKVLKVITPAEQRTMKHGEIGSAVRTQMETALRCTDSSIPTADEASDTSSPS